MGHHNYSRESWYSRITMITKDYFAANKAPSAKTAQKLIDLWLDAPQDWRLELIKKSKDIRHMLTVFASNLEKTLVPDASKAANIFLDIGIVSLPFESIDVEMKGKTIVYETVIDKEPIEVGFNDRTGSYVSIACGEDDLKIALRPANGGIPAISSKLIQIALDLSKGGE